MSSGPAGSQRPWAVVGRPARSCRGRSCPWTTPRPHPRRLDLRRWRVARNAGEVVRPQTIARFLRHLRPASLSPSAMCPSYGLAEATLTVTTCGPDVPARELTVSVAGLDRGLVEAVPA